MLLNIRLQKVEYKVYQPAQVPVRADGPAIEAQHGLEVPLALLVAAGCVIFVASTAFGFTVLGKIAQVAVPVIALVLCYILYVATHTEVAVPAAIVEMNTGVAVSTVVGTIIVLVATLPDFGSFVHNRKHALIAAGVTFLVAYPLLYWAGATPSAISGQGSLLGAMAVFGAVCSRVQLSGNGISAHGQ